MTARTLRDELIVGTHPVLKIRTAFVLPVIPDAAPYAVREGIARRRITTLTGACPCGAVMDTGTLVAGKVTRAVAVEHEGSCPAITARLAKALRRWLR